jgi:hypothetical protein
MRWATLAAILLTAAGSAAATQRSSLIAFDARTGKLVAGFPKVTGGQVYAVVDDGRGGWYVGGKFASIGGVHCPNLAHITAGVRKSVDHGWCPRPDGTIRALLRVGSTLYVGGEFLHKIADKVRRGLAAFDTGSGRLSGWNPGLSGLDDAAYDLAAVGSSIYVAGSFDKLGGAKRSNLGAISTTTGRATSFAPNPDEDNHGDSVTVLAVGPHAVYALGYYSHIGGKPNATGAAALDPQTGHVLPAWRPKLMAAPYAAVVDGSNVLVAANGLFELNATTGAQRHVTKTGGDFVGAIALAGSRVYASLESDHFSKVAHRFVAFESPGKTVWRGAASLTGFVNTIAVSGGLVVVGGSR